MADKKGIVLSERGKEQLDWVVDRVRQLFGNTTGRGREGNVEHEEYLAPEVYIAKTPSNGIPARVGPTPGFADCNIYNLISISSGLSLDLTQVPSLFRTVYNLSTGPFPGDFFTPVKRDKFGKWWTMGTCKEVVTNVACSNGQMVQTKETVLVLDIGCTVAAPPP